MELTQEERELFTRLQPAGYILFSRNIVDYELTRELTDELRRLTQGPWLPIIAIDQEGGRVVRTADLGVHLPSAAALAATRSGHMITQAAFYTARCLDTLGVNVNLAPVLDLASPHANALPSRCWGTEPDDVISYAGMWNRALYRHGIMTCGKHFPGMGEAVCDPHFELPHLAGSRDDFLRKAAIPFTALMPELPSMMMAHLMIPEMDAEWPTSLSRPVVQGFLRDQLGYEGVVFTDDLCMGAIAKQYSPEQAVVHALNAGCDLPLICHDAVSHLDAVAGAVSRLPDLLLQEVASRVGHFRMQLVTHPPMSFLEWNDFLKALEGFAASVPEPEAGRQPLPVSPVQQY